VSTFMRRFLIAVVLFAMLRLAPSVEAQCYQTFHQDYQPQGAGSGKLINPLPAAMCACSASRTQAQLW
jgi:hypothetical protein